jgi:hypothetical protein
LVLKFRETLFKEPECLLGFGGDVSLIFQSANLRALFGNDAAAIQEAAFGGFELFLI